MAEIKNKLNSQGGIRLECGFSIGHIPITGYEVMSDNYVVWFEKLRMADVERVGGKNASLGEMISQLTGCGVRVPGGFATTADAFRDFLRQNDLNDKINQLLTGLNVENVAELVKVGAQIRQWVLDTPFPAGVEQAINLAWQKMLDEAGNHDDICVAVRSSATAEDLPDASFAGQQETFLNIRGLENVKRAIKEVFASIVSSEVRQVLKVDGTLFIDFFETFTGELENEFRQKASLSIGKAHGMTSEKSYDLRINAINFSLNHDDGIKTGDLDEAEVILVGVSRSGKTPTCLYLALQYGIKAANYPLTPDDLGTTVLPKMLQPYRNKLFGLTIQPQRLHTIRTERRPDSRYASLENCRFEVNEAESIFRQQRIPYINATHKSIEEIATTILHNSGLTRHF